VVTEANALKGGQWQQTIGTGLKGKVLGILGLGRIGSAAAKIGQAFGMEVIAWTRISLLNKQTKLAYDMSTKLACFKKLIFCPFTLF
jgi:phosphoglycerate dehydrogenase-like enzyme